MEEAKFMRSWLLGVEELVCVCGCLKKGIEIHWPFKCPQLWEPGCGGQTCVQLWAWVGHGSATFPVGLTLSPRVMKQLRGQRGFSGEGSRGERWFPGNLRALALPVRVGRR